MNQETQLWYIKVNEQIKGPFASGLISKYILLGRIQPEDLLSQDKELWHKASSIPEVKPDVNKHPEVPNYKERFNAARRWADERGEVREVVSGGGEKIFKPRKKITHLQIKTTGRMGFVVLLVAICILIYTMYVFTPDAPLANIDCSISGQDGSVFDGCHLARKDFSKLSLNSSSFKNAVLQNSQFRQSSLQNSQLDYANLSHADLSEANLTGASLRAADLRGAILNAANLTQADLSYADLSGAKAAEINLNGTILHNTIWFNGKICDKSSVGRCLNR